MNFGALTATKGRRLALLALVLLPIALHLGIASAKLVVRELELAIDANPGHDATGFIYRDNGTAIAFPENAQGLREGTVPATPERPHATHVTFRRNEASRTLSDVTVDGEPLDASRIVDTRDFMPHTDAFEFVVLRLPRDDGKRPLAMAGLSALLWIALLALFHPVFERRRALGLSALSLFTVSDGWKKHVPKRAIGIAFGVVLLTTLSIVGVDAVSIYDLFRGSAAGLDIYQFQVNFLALWHFEFPTFPYNPLMLEFWTFFDRPWGALFGHAPLLYGQPYLQVLVIKLVNAGLLTLTILSVISFAEEEKLLTRPSRWLFYLAFFNPVLFYVAILFVQFDTVPLYFITLGVLLSHRFDRHGVVGPALFTAGCMMKTQGMVLVPTAAIAFFYNALSSGERRWKTAGLGLFAMAFVMAVFRVAPGRYGSPLRYLLDNTAQINRAFQGYAYAPELYVYFLMGTVTLVLLFFVFSLRVGLAPRDVIVASMLTSGAVIMVFNASHIYTPSTLLQMGGAITLVVAMERDSLRRFAYASATVLIAMSAATQPYGDISRVVPGREGYFTTLVPKLDTLARIKFNSLPFSLSLAAMIAYAVVFLRGARSRLAESTPE